MCKSSRNVQKLLNFGLNSCKKAKLFDVQLFFYPKYHYTQGPRKSKLLLLNDLVDLLDYFLRILQGNFQGMFWAMFLGILKNFQKYFGCFTIWHLNPFPKLFQPSKLGVSMIFELFIPFFVSVYEVMKIQKYYVIMFGYYYN